MSKNKFNFGFNEYAFSIKTEYTFEIKSQYFKIYYDVSLQLRIISLNHSFKKASKIFEMQAIQSIQSN